VVSVLERRSEIGLRRALGARRGFVGSLILIESTLLCVAGAVAGGLAGLVVTWVSAVNQAAAVQVPLLPVGLGLAGSVVVGLVAGLYPALRAAHLAPAAALRIAG
jgi:putative ABC transport system permease protein